MIDRSKVVQLSQVETGYESSRKRYLVRGMSSASSVVAQNVEYPVKICSNSLGEVESSGGDLVNCNVRASSDSGFVCVAR